MQTRFRTAPIALSLWLAAPASFAQPAQPPAAPPAAPPPAAKPPAPAAPAPAKPAPAPAAPAPAAPAPNAAEPAPAPLAPAPDVAPAAEPEGEGEPALPPAAPADAQPPSELPAAPMPAWPEPSADASALSRMGNERPGKPRSEETDVFAEDWWSHARPVFEFHGYLRVRAELFYRFSLGRLDAPQDMTWPRPPDVPYAYSDGSRARLGLCTEEEAGAGSSTSTDELVRCTGNTQAGANLRFRLNPEIHVSDNARIIAQVDLLDNLVLGSTSSGYAVTPAAGSGYAVANRTGYGPLGFTDGTTAPPRSGVNSFSDSIHVKRVWGEYSTPVGELRFGRMPNHWGLGMVYHSGDGYDDDYQSTIDRLQFVSGIKPLELYLSAAWDFPNEGPTSDNLSIPRAQAYDVGQLDDVDQYVFTVARRKSPELQRLALARGELVVNGGVHLTYRSQLLSANDSLAGDPNGDCAGGDTDVGGTPLGCQPGDFSNSYVRRDAQYWLPDVWVQLLYKKFRFELEAATIQGSVGNASTVPNSTLTGEYDFRQWGFAAELEQLLVEDRLKLGLGFGWASGDADVDGLIEGGSGSGAPFGQIGGDRDIETFRFNPSYRVDLILFRNILSRIQGAYYFRPNLSYDFVREPAGQKLGGTIAAVWSRASEFIQSPGHDRDLGIELNAAIYFQSKDGALNDDPTQMGGFYSRLEYGVLFPMAGLGYPGPQAEALQERLDRRELPDVSSAQTVRLYLGVLF